MAAVLVCLFGVAACSDEPAGAADGPPSIPRSVPADAGASEWVVLKIAQR